MRYLTPDEAAEELLGWAGEYRGQKLLRIVMRKEKAEGREIAIRNNFEGNGTRYKLTEAMLRLHFPELFIPQVDAVARELAHRIDELRATIGAAVDERIAPQIQAVRASHASLAKEVVRLTTSTNDGFSRVERRIAKIESELDEKSRQESSAISTRSAGP